MFTSFGKRKPISRRTTNDQDQPSNPTPPDSDPTNDDQDETGFASSDYARQCRELLQLNKALRDMGADTIVELPRIAVIGSQSTGKSSLVEAVSGINVPRDAGTCTRCPTECSMFSSAETWSCAVSLRFDYDENGRKLLAPNKVDFSSVIKDKNDVELWLRRAQAAILSPHLPPHSFRDKSAPELLAMKADPGTLKFSKNVVCIDIEDPDTTDLSFVDLPGLIQNESPDAIDLVKNLVESYIESEKTFILIAVPVSDDIENQQAVRLAKVADPEGKRTIGVLTKPDTLTKGATSSRQKWKDILEGRIPEHRLKLGYYCVRLPDDDERLRKISRNECQQLADDLFNSTPPWKEIDDRSRFGVPSLISNLSKVLIDLIRDTLPKLQEDVNRLLEDCQKKLDEMPSPLTVDPTTEIINRVTGFSAAVSGAVSGDGLKSLAQRNRKLYDEWKKKIRGTAPDFRPFLNQNQYSKPSWPDQEVATEPDVPVETFDLTKVREVIDKSIAWELPHNIPFEAKKALILKSTSLWKLPTESCFNSVFQSLFDVLEDLIREYFGRFERLEIYISGLIEKEIDQCKETAHKALLKTLELEKTPLFTQNRRFFDSERAEWLTRFRDKHRNTNYPPQPFDEEMTVMAEVRAYFEVAYRRVIDYIPLTIEHELCQALANNLQQTLIETLFSEQDVSAEMRREFVSEDPEIARQRIRLGEWKRRLEEIKQKLNGSPMRTRRVTAITRSDATWNGSDGASSDDAPQKLFPSDELPASPVKKINRKLKGQMRKEKVPAITPSAWMGSNDGVSSDDAPPPSDGLPASPVTVHVWGC